MAAQEVQNGKAYVHGIRNDGTPITISGFASFTIESAKVGFKWKMDALENELGFDESLVWSNGMLELDIAFQMTGATRAAAETTAAFIQPGATVTMAHFAVGTFNGDWLNTGDQAIDLSHKQGKMTLKLRRYADADQNASLVQTVTG